jgi:hypothetical protein
LEQQFVGVDIYASRATCTGAILDTHLDSGATVGGTLINHAANYQERPSSGCTSSGCWSLGRKSARSRRRATTCMHGGSHQTTRCRAASRSAGVLASSGILVNTGPTHEISPTGICVSTQRRPVRRRLVRRALDAVGIADATGGDQYGYGSRSQARCCSPLISIGATVRPICSRHD